MSKVELGYCPSCMKSNTDGVLRICAKCIERRDTKYEHTEEDVQEEIQKNIDKTIRRSVR